MKRKKINLAVIFYGNPEQLPANREQFSDLKKNLFDFNLKKYDFNKGERQKLLNDFKKKKIDVVLKNSYGRGHESDIESFLELNKIPYFGSNAKVTFLGTSKSLAKEIFRLAKLPVAKDVYVNKKIWNKSKAKIIKQVKEKIIIPCLIKDIGGTDSRGISVIKNNKQVERFLDQAVSKYGGVIVEQYIKNAYEATCLVVGNKNPIAYEPVGLIKKEEIISGKIKDQGIKTEIPANLPKTVIKQIKKLSIFAHKALGCKTFSRSDILVKNKKLYLIEVDVHPGFRSVSPTSLSAKYAGQSLNQLFLEFYKLIK